MTGTYTLGTDSLITTCTKRLIMYISTLNHEPTINFSSETASRNSGWGCTTQTPLKEGEGRPAKERLLDSRPLLLLWLFLCRTWKCLGDKLRIVGCCAHLADFGEDHTLRVGRDALVETLIFWARRVDDDVSWTERH